MILKTNSGVLCGKVFDIEKFIEFVNPNRIYLDVDGVLFHSCEAICKLINLSKHTNFNGTFQGRDILSWNFKEFGLDFIDTEIEQLFSIQEFFCLVDYIDGAYEFLKRHAKDITIVTKGTKENIWYKSVFFENLNIPICGLPLSCSKNTINMDGGLLIDDSTKNLKESNATYKIQFLEYKDGKNNLREWTKDWKGLKMYKW